MEDFYSICHVCENNVLFLKIVLEYLVSNFQTFVWFLKMCDMMCAMWLVKNLYYPPIRNWQGIYFNNLLDFIDKHEDGGRGCMWPQIAFWYKTKNSANLWKKYRKCVTHYADRFSCIFIILVCLPKLWWIRVKIRVLAELKRIV